MHDCYEVQEIIPDTNKLLLYTSRRGLFCFHLTHLLVLSIVDCLGCMVMTKMPGM